MITAKAQGKINLVFQVGPLRSDGYHEVASIYQALEIEESVSVVPSDSWQVVTEGDAPGIGALPQAQDNLVVIAARALAAHAGIDNPRPMKFLIKKQIPVAGGMAGGSADAAAALVALNEAWCLGLEQVELLRVGSKIGADVPFAILGGTAFGGGTGTELKPIQPHPQLHVLLVFAEFGLSTKAVFEAFDELRPQGDLLSLEFSKQYEQLIGHNSLQPAALAIRPELARVLELNLGIRGGYLSGSGPTIWFYSDSESRAKAALELAQSFGLRALLTKTSNLGARLI